MGLLSHVREIYHAYSPTERRNIAIYIIGIMFYKLGLEAFNGSIVTLATDRFGSGSTYKKLGILQGLNQAFQVCILSYSYMPNFFFLLSYYISLASWFSGGSM